MSFGLNLTCHQGLYIRQKVDVAQGIFINLHRRSVKCQRTFPAAETLAETENELEQDSPSRTRISVKQRLRGALGQIRAQLFVHVDDERICWRLCRFLQFHQWIVSWIALLQF